MKEQTLTNALGTTATVSIVLSIIMIILGCLAIALPGVAGVGFTAMVAWLIIFAGIAHFIHAFTAEGPGAFIWRMLIAAAYIVGGIYLMLNMGVALGGLTLAVAAIFVIEGIFQIAAYSQVRNLPGAGWLIFDAIISIGLGVWIGYLWPESSTWFLGTLVGVNLLSSGVSRLMYSVAAKKALAAA